MIWSNWQGAIGRGAVVVVLFWSGLAWTQSPASRPAGDAPECIMVVHEAGKSTRCRVVESWQLPDGRLAHLLQSLDAGEMVTIVDDGPPTPGLGGKPKAMAKRIFAWGAGKSTPPLGAPIPPRLRHDSGVVLKNENAPPAGAMIGDGPMIINHVLDEKAVGGLIRTDGKTSAGAEGQKGAPAQILEFPNSSVRENSASSGTGPMIINEQPKNAGTGLPGPGRTPLFPNAIWNKPNAAPTPNAPSATPLNDPSGVQRAGGHEKPGVPSGAIPTVQHVPQPLAGEPMPKSGVVPAVQILQKPGVAESTPPNGIVQAGQVVPQPTVGQPTPTNPSSGLPAPPIPQPSPALIQPIEPAGVLPAVQAIPIPLETPLAPRPIDSSRLQPPVPTNPTPAPSGPVAIQPLVQPNPTPVSVGPIVIQPAAPPAIGPVAAPPTPFGSVGLQPRVQSTPIAAPPVAPIALQPIPTPGAGPLTSQPIAPSGLAPMALTNPYPVAPLVADPTRKIFTKPEDPATKKPWRPGEVLFIWMKKDPSSPATKPEPKNPQPKKSFGADDLLALQNKTAEKTIATPTKPIEPAGVLPAVQAYPVPLDTLSAPRPKDSGLLQPPVAVPLTSQPIAPTGLQPIAPANPNPVAPLVADPTKKILTKPEDPATKKPWRAGEVLFGWMKKDPSAPATKPEPKDPQPKNAQPKKGFGSDDPLAQKKKPDQKSIAERVDKMPKVPFSTALAQSTPPEVKKPEPAPLAMPSTQKPKGESFAGLPPLSSPPPVGLTPAPNPAPATGPLPAPAGLQQTAAASAAEKRDQVGPGTNDKVQPPGRTLLDPSAMKAEVGKLPAAPTRTNDPLTTPERYLPNDDRVKTKPPVTAPVTIPVATPPAPTPAPPAPRETKPRVEVASARESAELKAPSPVEAPSLPPYPLGTQSVVAARSGSQGPVYLPVPLMTVPQPNNPPMPPPPQMPEAPQLNAYVNAFSQPPAPKAAAPVGPSSVPAWMQPNTNMMMQHQMMQQQALMQQQMYQQQMYQQQMMQHQAMLAQAYRPQMYPPNPYMGYANPTPSSGPMSNVARHYAGPTPPMPYNPSPVMPASYMQASYPPMAQTSSGQQVQSLITVMRESPYPAQREWAAQSLMSFEWRSHPYVVPALLWSASQDPAASVRAGCVNCLGRMGAAVEPVFTTLHGMRNDTDPRVRQEVEQAFSRLGQSPMMAK